MLESLVANFATVETENRKIPSENVVSPPVAPVLQCSTCGSRHLWQARGTQNFFCHACNPPAHPSLVEPPKREFFSDHNGHTWEVIKNDDGSESWIKLGRYP